MRICPSARILTAMFGMLAGSGLATAQAPAPASAPPKPAMRTTAPASMPANPAAQREEPSEVPLLVHAGEETTLSSQMAGKIRRLQIGLGDNVRAGATLIEFDCSEQIAQQQAAEAEYRGARETHVSRLRLQGLGAAGELDVTLAAAAAEKARSQLALRESLTAYCTVIAPFSGKVARLRVKVAESVPAGQALLDLVNPASLRGQVFVPAAWAAWLRTGSEVDVTFKDTGRKYRARVAKLNARVEGVSQQLELEVRFEGANVGLLPGMVGTAVFLNRPAR